MQFRWSKQLGATFVIENIALHIGMLFASKLILNLPFKSLIQKESGAGLESASVAISHREGSKNVFKIYIGQDF